jgi:hypothetical protein
MTSSIQILRSTTSQDRPYPNNLLDGQPAININAGEPGLFFKATDGTIFKIGPAAITSNGSPPNAAGVGQLGNCKGELWLDQSVSPAVLKVYDGTSWITVSGSSIGPIDTNDIVNGAVTTPKIGNLAVETGKLQDAAVTTAKLDDDSVTNSKLAAGSVSGAELQSNSVGSIKIQDGAVIETKIADSSVSTAKLQLNSVDAARLGVNAVEEIKIQASAVTTTKIADAAVTSVKLADGAVTTNKVADSSITSAKIASNTIVDGDVSTTAAIQSSKLEYSPVSIGSSTGVTPRSARSKLNDRVSVKDFGATGNGSTDDTVAIQAAFTWFANQQNVSIPSTYGEIFFPQGIYKITSPINVFGYVSITGVGTGYIAGSVIRQYTADTDIFRFYANQIDNVGLGVNVQGLIFEHFPNSGTFAGAALKFPRINPATGLPMSSNSLYIRDCRYGALYPYGRFFDAEASGDIEISGCCIDVCRGNEAIKLGKSNSAVNQCAAVRIVNSLFFAAKNAINVSNATNVLIADNIFSNQDIPGGYAITLASDGTGSSGEITSINISDNIFDVPRKIVKIDGLASQITYDSNVHHKCTDFPFTITGTTPIYSLKITNNRWLLANGVVLAGSPTTYSNTNIIEFDSTATVTNFEFSDNFINAGQVGVVTEFFNDQASSSFIAPGASIRNNIISNNTPGSNSRSYLTYVPANATELEIISERTWASLPTNAELFLFNSAGLAVGDTVTFDIDYAVACANLPTSSAGLVGRASVAIILAEIAGAPKSVITPIFSIGDDSAGSGGLQIPAVTFSVRATPNPAILMTVTWASAGTVAAKFRAYNFTSTGSVYIKAIA